MKKFISMVMAAAMVVSLVPATAFAAGEVKATAKIVDAWEKQAGEFDGVVTRGNVPELQLTVTNVDYQKTYVGELPTAEVELKLDNADFTGFDASDVGVRLSRDAAEDQAAAEGAANADVAEAQKVVDAAKAAATKATADATKAAKAVDTAKKAAETAYVAPTELANKATIAAAQKDAADKALEAADKAVSTKADALKTAEDKYIATPNATNLKAVETAEKALADAKVAAADAKVAADEAAAKATAAADAIAADKEAYVAKDAGVVAAEKTAAAKAEAADKAAAALADAEAALEAAKAEAGEVANDITFAVVVDDDNDEATVTITGFLHVGDIVYFDLTSTMDKYGEGKVATVSVDSDLVEAKDLVYVSVLGKVLEASIDDVVEVAVDEVVALDDDGLVIEAAVGTLPSTITLKLSKGFEFVAEGKVAGATVTLEDEDEIEITGVTGSKIVVTGIEVQATTANVGDVATIKVVAPKWASASVEVVKVIDYTVVMSVDEDEDVPVFYSGVSATNEYINDDADHVSLEVTIEETFAGAWDMDKAFTLSLPEGVYVTAVDADGDLATRNDDSLDTAFEKAYIKGEHIDFEFAKRVFIESDPEFGPCDYTNDVTFTLTLIADPGFVGDVVLTLEGAAVETQEVTIAKFVAPMTVKAEQNDVIIDYRYTEVPTSIVVTEAEAGLWDEGLTVSFEVEKADMIKFEDEATFEVNEASDMEIKDSTKEGVMTFVVTEESEEEAAVVTISGIELFMQRNIPAGPYDLDVKGINAVAEYDKEVLLGQATCKHGDCETKTAADVNDYSTVAKEAWINVVTAGRDQDDASFTTTVVVPVGETTMYAGEKAITLDVPAYINAAGYTMLPVRAVATALGINNDAVQWDQATKTVIIMYGQRIITMTAGSSVVYVSGTAIPAKSAVEIVDGRAFLGLRDLATTLGVANIAWDPATNVATLNPKA